MAQHVSSLHRIKSEMGRRFGWFRNDGQGIMKASSYALAEDVAAMAFHTTRQSSLNSADNGPSGNGSSDKARRTTRSPICGERGSACLLRHIGPRIDRAMSPGPERM
jgi:hypothetical protein